MNDLELPDIETDKHLELPVRYTPADLKDGFHAKILNKIRTCKLCPMRERITVVGAQRIIKPSPCPYYAVSRKECPIGEQMFLLEANRYMEKFNASNDPYDVLEQALTHQVANQLLSEQIEIMEKGRPGFYSKAFGDSVTNLAIEMYKLKHPVNQVTNINFDLNLKKWREEREKIVDVEFKESRNN